MEGAELFGGRAGVAVVVRPARFGGVRGNAMEPQTVPGTGAGQGVFLRDGFVYLFGDAETGVIRECTLHSTRPFLRPTGRDIRLTVRGKDIAPHPTGLTHHPLFGTFLGDTVAQKGTIFMIDWDGALMQGTLDGAVLATIRDDAAFNGTRPEFVRYLGRWWIATSDYGNAGNEVRLYDPARLARAERTSEPGVVAHRFACGPFVQSLRWIDETDTLVLVQNQIVGLRYRLSFADLASLPENGDLRAVPVLDLAQPTDELQGFTPLPDGRWLFFNASRADNVWFGTPAKVRSPGPIQSRSSASMIASGSARSR